MGRCGGSPRAPSPTAPPRRAEEASDGHVRLRVERTPPASPAQPSRAGGAPGRLHGDRTGPARPSAERPRPRLRRMLEPVHSHHRLRVLARGDLGVATPVTLLALGGYTLVAGGAPSSLRCSSRARAAVLGGVTLWDYPRRAVLQRLDGIDRVCFLRTQHLAWDTIVAIERPRGSALSQVRLKGTPPAASTDGGLVARAAGSGGTCSPTASRAGRVRRAGPPRGRGRRPTIVRASRPALDVAPPTDLYRRGRRAPARGATVTAPTPRRRRDRHPASGPRGRVPQALDGVRSSPTSATASTRPRSRCSRHP